MSITRHIVTCIDRGDSCDGRPRVLGTYETAEEAKAYVENDIKDTIDEATDDDGFCPWEIDDDFMGYHDSVDEHGCTYNIEAIEIELTEGEEYSAKI